LISQLLTLYTTPVLYLYLDQLSGWPARIREWLFRRGFEAPPAAPAE
jgi:hypothetical protein